MYIPILTNLRRAQIDRRRSRLAHTLMQLLAIGTIEPIIKWQPGASGQTRPNRLLYAGIFRDCDLIFRLTPNHPSHVELLVDASRQSAKIVLVPVTSYNQLVVNIGQSIARGATKSPAAINVDRWFKQLLRTVAQY